MTGFEKAQKRYDSWWLGKICLAPNTGVFKKVVRVELHGPPSFVVGVVKLHFEDGTCEFVRTHPNAYKPKKTDVQVKEK
jgi:hypothetical protein